MNSRHPFFADGRGLQTSIYAGSWRKRTADTHLRRQLGNGIADIHCSPATGKSAADRPFSFRHQGIPDTEIPDTHFPPATAKSAAGRGNSRHPFSAGDCKVGRRSAVRSVSRPDFPLIGGGITAVRNQCACASRANCCESRPEARSLTRSAHAGANSPRCESWKCRSDSLVRRAADYPKAMAAARWPWNQDWPKRAASAASD
jgi:hypothetical protein